MDNVSERTWEELGYIKLDCMQDLSTGIRYISANSLTTWLTIVKDKKPQLGDSIDFLIRQLHRESHTTQ